MKELQDDDDFITPFDCWLFSYHSMTPSGFIPSMTWLHVSRSRCVISSDLIWLSVLFSDFTKVIGRQKLKSKRSLKVLTVLRLPESVNEQGDGGRRETLTWMDIKSERSRFKCWDCRWKCGNYEVNPLKCPLSVAIKTFLTSFHFCEF